MTGADLLDRLEGVLERGPGRWIARCPAHEDRRPSLSVRELEDGMILVHDFAGCPTLDICHAIGIEYRDLFPERRIRRIDHSERPRLPAADGLKLIEHELTVATIIGADFLVKKTITESDWQRLARAVERIGAVRDG